MVSAEEKASLYNEFTPDKISSFTCSLIQNEEYYRAYVELLRIKSYYPSYLHPSAFAVTSNYLFYKSKKYNDLLAQDFDRTGDEIFIPLSLFRVDSLIKLEREKDADAELTKLYARPDSADYSAYLNKRSLYLSVLNNENSDSNFKDKYPEYEELYIYSKSIYDKRKNPYLGALAGIFPGMGYFYSGESGTGIVSIIVIGAGSAVTYASYRNGLDSLAVFTGLITFFFYGGSIAGGYMQTVKYNDRLMETVEMRLNRELMPERDLEEIYLKFGLNSNDCK
jgi:TM2 domain-containing membrane protein YozV